MNPTATVSNLSPSFHFVAGLREAHLFKQPHAEAIKAFLAAHPDAKPAALADDLVDRQLLTRYQADQALAGNAARLTLWTYTLLEPVGHNSRPSLFKARNKTDNQLCCVKVLPRRNAINLPKFARQLKPFQQFKHESVVPIIHIGAFGDRQYLAWPFVSEGETLKELVRRRDKLSVEQTLRLGLQAAEGLALCHEHAMIHGVLKPANVVVTPDGHLRMLGFGIGFLLTMGRAESLIDTMNTTEQLASCIDCGAPEALLDQTNRTPAGDQYSLGCVLYFCLTGQYPFPDGSDVQKVMAHQEDEPAPLRELNPEVPAWLEAVVQRLMQKRPEDRFPDMRHAVQALKGKRVRPRSLVSDRNGPVDASRQRPRVGAATPQRAAGSPPAGASPVVRRFGWGTLLWIAAVLTTIAGGVAAWWLLS